MNKGLMYKPKSKVICLKCNTVVYSKQEGELTYCKSGYIGIDETRFYCEV